MSRLALIAVSLIFFQYSAQAAVPAIEREALVVLFNSTNGKDWQDNDFWFNGDPCEGHIWFGIVCSEAGNIIGIDLRRNLLIGTIPFGLGTLGSLERLDFSENRLSGPIPVDLGKLNKLSYVFLAGNQLSGAIPFELGTLTSLEFLDLSENQLNGPIPAELGNLNRLSVLNLQDNQLTGSIPGKLGNLSRLMLLNLRSNQLTGPIPVELGSLSDLQISRSDGLDLRWNALYTDNAVLDTLLDYWHKYDVQRNRDWSKTQTVAPANLRVSSIDSDSITLAWDPVEFTENEGGFRVWYGMSSGGRYMDGGITANKSNLVTSENSNEIFVRTSLAKPTSVRATDGTFLSLVRVTFNPVADATVYRVFRCLDLNQTCGSPIGYPNASTFDDRNAVPGTVYYYRVRACIANACGKFSVANTGFANIPPPKPTDIRASDGSYPDHVEITWIVTENASIYRVFRCLDKGQTCGSPIGYPNGNSFEDRKGAASTVYQYRVKACNTRHCSKFSVANAGHRSDTPAITEDEINAFLLPDQQVPIPSLSTWGRWSLMLMMLGIGLVLLNRQYPRNSRVRA